MGCRDHTAVHFAAEFNNRHGQSRAFSRVCASTKLIKKHKRPVIALLHNIHNCPHMAGEGGKALGNGLFISNVRKDGIKG